MSYNVKIIEYPETGEAEIRFYTEVIQKGFKPKKSKKNTSVGILQEVGTNDNFKDKERSARVSANRAKNKIYDYARANRWEYFVTLTFNPEKVNSRDYDEVTKKLSQWLDNFKRRKAPELKYLGVPELHEKGGFHFHLLMSNIGEMELIDSGKRDRAKRTIYNLGNYKLGFTTATEISDTLKASNYITKYMTSAFGYVAEGKRKYWNSKNLNCGLGTELYLDDKEFNEMKREVKREKTSHKVSTIDCNGYYNLIDYYQIKL